MPSAIFSTVKSMENTFTAYFLLSPPVVFFKRCCLSSCLMRKLGRDLTCFKLCVLAQQSFFCSNILQMIPQLLYPSQGSSVAEQAGSGQLMCLVLLMNHCLWWKPIFFFFWVQKNLSMFGIDIRRTSSLKTRKTISVSERFTRVTAFPVLVGWNFPTLFFNVH